MSESRGTAHRDAWFFFVALGFLVVFPATAGSGVLGDFGPYPDSERIAQAPLTSCPSAGVVQTKEGSVEEFTLPGRGIPFLRLEVPPPSSGNRAATLRLAPGPGWPTYEGILEGAVWFRDVLTGDLNGDDRPDFVLAYTPGGEEHRGVEDEPAPGDNVLFFLSGKDRHRLLLVQDVRYDPKGFVSLMKDRSVQWIHTAFVSKHGGRSRYPDRRIYFYLHRLFHVKGDTLAADEGMVQRFPRIVSYTPGVRRKNHKETQLLAPEQKQELVASNPPRISEWDAKVTMPPKQPIRKKSKR